VKADDLKRQWKDASDYVAMYGKSEPHLPGSVGKLHNVEVETEIGYQAAPSEKNYWKSANFDEALEKVIKAQFPALAKAALELMEGRYRAALVAEKGALLARLAEIQAIEEQA
jgi:hypothetical protein